MNNPTFRGHPLISDQVNPKQLAVLWRELEAVLRGNIPGDVVEFGCYTGTSSLFMRRLLDETGHTDSKAFHVYDSFAGLPAKSPQDRSGAGEAFVSGELTASRAQLLQNFKQAGLRPPVVHKGWFDRLTAQDVPEQVGFAFLDGDFYRSIMDSLKLVWPRLQPGGRLMIDDYRREALPGVERAVHDYFTGRGEPLPEVRVEHDLGIIRR